MKLSFYNIGITILKLIVASLLLGYLYALYHVMYVDEVTKTESIIKNMINALALLVWIIALLLSGVSPKDILKS
tara:strand:- start:60 stop:281 length:222 start_codon:yes stop_codon:yes gene_type:complete